MQDILQTYKVWVMWIMLLVFFSYKIEAIHRGTGGTTSKKRTT